MNFSENSIFFKIGTSLFVGLGVLLVRQALFLKIFENFENFRRLSIPWMFSYDLYFRRYTCLKSPENRLYWLFSSKTLFLAFFWVPWPKCLRGAEKLFLWPQNFFGSSIGSKGLWEKKASFSCNIRPKFGLKCEFFWLFRWPKITKMVEILANLGRKTTFVWETFSKNCSVF